MGSVGRYIKARPEFIWKRNTQWPAIPADDGTETKLYVVFAVIEDNPNILKFTLNNDSVVDWGDGTTSTAASGTTYPDIQHTYDYSTITGVPILTLEDGRNYKPVLVEVDMELDTGSSRACLCYVDGDENSHNALEVVSYLGDGNPDGSGSSRVYISTLAIAHICEHVYLKSPNEGSNLRCFRYMTKLKKLELPSNFFNIDVSNWDDGFNGTSLYGQNLGDVSIDNATSDAVFRYSDNFKIGRLTLGSSTTNGNSFFIHANNYSIGDVIALNNTIGLYFFGGTVNNGPYSIGEINMPLLEDARYMFRNARSLPEVVMTDCININNTLGMFLSTGSLQRIVLNRLTIGVDVSGNQMTADAIDELFTSLGTAAGTQTIDVSGMPGSAGCDTSIATAKGWTVVT